MAPFRDTSSPGAPFWDWTPPLGRALASLAIGSFFATLLLAMTLPMFLRTSFKKPLKQASKLLGIEIAPDTSMERLHKLAKMRLTSMARTLYFTELAVAANSHDQHCYDERAQARGIFCETHKFLKQFGLAQERWDPYFHFQGK